MDAEIFKAIIMGIVQGLTEFFPVSSTAHLILIPKFFGWGGEIDTLTFDVALHAGTLFALLIYFYREWIAMLTRDHRTLLTVMIAAVPAGVAGLLFKKMIETVFRSPLIICVTLVLFGLVMLAADRFSERFAKEKGNKLKTEPSPLDALVIGVAQILALIPGVSRSGVTMSAGLFKKLSREGAARFSFLVSTPLIGGATLYEGRHLFTHPEGYRLDVFAAGVFAAALSGFFAILFLLKFLKTHRFDAFVWYRFGLSAVILVMYLKG